MPNMLAQLSTDVMPEFQTLADNGWCFSSLSFAFAHYNLLLLYIPTTLGCHGNIFGYVEAQAFTYTLVSSKFLRNVLMSRYNYMHIYVPTFTNLWYSRLQAL